MFNKQDRIDNRDKNNTEKREYLSDKERLISIQVDKIKRVYDGMENRLHELHEKRSAIFATAVKKDEFSKHAKASLRSAKEYVLRGVADHLKDCHSRGIVPFGGNGEVHLVRDFDLHRLIFLAISDEDLDGLIEKLPDGEMTEKERNERLKTINDEIDKLKEDMKAHIEKAKRGEIVFPEDK